MRSALREPIELTAAVLVFGIVFRLSRARLDRVSAATRIFGQRWLCFALTIVLGLLAGFIAGSRGGTRVRGSYSLLKMDRSSEVAATVLGCFAIGLGAVRRPGDAASTLVLAALHADFFYLARLLGPFVIVGIILVAIPTLFLREENGDSALQLVPESDSLAPVLIRAGKVYIFIVGLVGLSAGLRPMADAYLRDLPGALLSGSTRSRRSWTMRPWPQWRSDPAERLAATVRDDGFAHQRWNVDSRQHTQHRRRQPTRHHQWRMGRPWPPYRSAAADFVLRSFVPASVFLEAPLVFFRLQMAGS